MAITKGKLTGATVIAVGWFLVISIAAIPKPSAEELEERRIAQTQEAEEREAIRAETYQSYKDYMLNNYGITLSDDEARALDCPENTNQTRFPAQRPCYSSKLLPHSMTSSVNIGYDYNQDSIPITHEYGTYTSDEGTYTLKSLSNSTIFSIELNK